MDKRDSLTNEKLKAKFISQFELVNYAIRLAENVIHSGRGPRVRIDTDNVAQQVVAEIQAGKDHLVEYNEEDRVESEPYTFSTLTITEEDFLNASDDFDDEDDEDDDEEEGTKKKKAKKTTKKSKKAVAD